MTDRQRRHSRRKFLKDSVALALTGSLAPMAASGTQRVSGGLARPIDLRCEYRKNPLGIDVLRPRLSWVLQPLDPAARGQKQTAYQILCASSEERLRSDQGDCWDTGKVESNRSIQVSYDGKPLTSRSVVWWKVRAWDRIGKVSDWSEPAFWSIGLLKPEDWKGDWIGWDGGEGKPLELSRARWLWSAEPGAGTRYFRRTFEVPPGTSIADALLFVVSSGRSSVYVNGRRQESTGNGIEQPVSIDVTFYLHEGTNLLAVSAAGATGVPSGVIASLRVELNHGETMTVLTNQDWRASRSGTPGWTSSGFDESVWQHARVIGDYGMPPWGDVGWAEHRVLPARMLRKQFRVAGSFRRATLYLSGLGLCEAYFNGSKISRDVLVPALSNYDKRAFYLTYDVTENLKQGENAIGVVLGNGRFFAPRLRVPTRTRTFGYPKMLFQLEIEYDDGHTERVVSDEAWKLTFNGPIRSNNVYDGEIYDARREMDGWGLAGFDDSGWQQAKRVSAPVAALAAQMIEPIRVIQSLQPIKLTQPQPAVYVFDMGQNMVGWCRLTVSGPRGTQVSLRHAETLQADGTVYLNNLRSAEATDVYILKGGGEEVYEPRFTYHGFRYVEMRGFPGQPGLSSLEGRVVHDALAPAGRFSTSNSLINHIYRNVVWGTRGNYRSVPTDCPQRDERQGWLGDRSAESRGETYFFDVAAFYAKWMDDIEDAQDAKGSVSDVSPAYWPFYNDDVTWPATFFIIPGHLYDQYEDLRVIERHYEGMKKWIDHMEGYIKDGLVPRDSFGDWCVPPESLTLIHSRDPSRQTDPTFLGTAYFYHLLQLMARYAALLNNKQDSEEYRQLARRLSAAFNKAFFNPDDAKYSNGSQTSSILPLAFGMVPESARPGLMRTLVENIQRQCHGHIGAGLIGCQWIMQVLSENGHADVAYEIAVQKTYPSWGYMISQGATTIWELWNGNTANPAMNSRNHLMLVGDLVTWFYENLAGIRSDPAQPGFKHIVMRPALAGDLTFVKAAHKSPYGEIVSEWSRDGNRFAWHLVVPVNTTATLYVPAAKASMVREGGRPADQAPEVRYLRREPTSAIYEVGPGEYRFSSILSAGPS